MSVNPEVLAGQPWGIRFPNAPTPADSAYNLNTLGFTTDGALYMLADNTEGAAVWQPFGFSKKFVYAKTTIDGTSVDNTVIATTDAMLGRFYVTGAFIHLEAVSNLVSVCTLSIGTNSTTFNNIIPATLLTGLSTVDLYIPLSLVSVPASVSASSNITLRVSIGAVASTFNIGCILEGTYA